MPDSTFRVFIGSSSEGRPFAEAIQQILIDEGLTAIGWWEREVFPAGNTFIESLEQAISNFNAAVMVATPDDLTILRDKEMWTARGNVLLEYGMFMGAHGRRRVAFATREGVTLPNDLSGVTHIELQGPLSDLGDKSYYEVRAQFMRLNRERFRAWIAAMDRESTSPVADARDVLPRLSEVVVSIIRSLKDKKDAVPYYGDIDVLASDMVEAVASAFDKHNYGMDDGLMDMISHLILPGCSAIHAVDVIGPRGWISPRTYRYLAPQIRRYIIANTDEESKWNLRVGPELGHALKTALQNVSQSGNLDQSLTVFDDIGFEWSEHPNPRLEFSRILLWSRQEILSPVAESVIAIHRLFNVPLFFLETERDAMIRDIDYIFFEVGGTIQGFYGRRGDRYATHSLDRQRIPQFGIPREHYYGLLNRPDIMLAHDAWHIMKSRN